MKEWVKKLFSSSQVASLFRTGTASSIIVFLGLDIFKTIYTTLHGVPGLTRDELIGQAIFVTSVYSPGKVGDVVQRFSPNPPADVDIPTPTPIPNEQKG